MFPPRQPLYFTKFWMQFKAVRAQLLFLPTLPLLLRSLLILSRVTDATRCVLFVLVWGELRVSCLIAFFCFFCFCFWGVKEISSHSRRLHFSDVTQKKYSLARSYSEVRYEWSLYGYIKVCALQIQEYIYIIMCVCLLILLNKTTPPFLSLSQKQ